MELADEDAIKAALAKYESGCPKKARPERPLAEPAKHPELTPEEYDRLPRDQRFDARMPWPDDYAAPEFQGCHSSLGDFNPGASVGKYQRRRGHSARTDDSSDDGSRY